MRVRASKVEASSKNSPVYAALLFTDVLCLLSQVDRGLQLPQETALKLYCMCTIPVLVRLVTAELNLCNMFVPHIRDKIYGQYIYRVF